MVWNEQTELYINNLLEKCKQNQWIHSTSEHYYYKRNITYTIMSLFLTSLAGTITFITSENQDNYHTNVVMGSVLYLSTILTGVQKLLNYDTLYIQHNTVLKKYLELEQYIQQQLLLDSEQRKSGVEIQNEISLKLKDIFDEIPMIPSSITSEFENRIR